MPILSSSTLSPFDIKVDSSKGVAQGSVSNDGFSFNSELSKAQESRQKQKSDDKPDNSGRSQDSQGLQSKKKPDDTAPHDSAGTGQADDSEKLKDEAADETEKLLPQGSAVDEATTDLALSEQGLTGIREGSTETEMPTKNLENMQENLSDEATLVKTTQSQEIDGADEQIDDTGVETLQKLTAATSELNPAQAVAAQGMQGGKATEKSQDLRTSAVDAGDVIDGTKTLVGEKSTEKVLGAQTANTALVDSKAAGGPAAIMAQSPSEQQEKSLLQDEFNLKNIDESSVKTPVTDLAASENIKANAALASGAEGLQGLEEAVGLPKVVNRTVAQGAQVPIDLSITKPVDEPGWDIKVFERVQWMVSARQQRAEIRLDPPDLGPLKVEVSVKQEQAQVTMTSHSSQVREILEQHLPRLREMLSSQGFDSVDAQTRDGQQSSDDKGHSGRGQLNGLGDEERGQEHEMHIAVEKSGKGLVDCYI